MLKYLSTNTIKIINIVMVSLLIAGCATMFSGTTDTITFTSNVDPVRVHIGGRNVGSTPLTIEVDRQTSKGPLVRFEKDGYESQEFYLEQKIDAVAYLDIFSIATSGVIDALSGAIMEFSPKQYHVEMLDSKVSNINDRQQQIQFARFVLFNTHNIQEDLAGEGGEYSAILVKIIDTHDSSKKGFEDWVISNKEMLLSTPNPEKFLASIRKSQMTP